MVGMPGRCREASGHIAGGTHENERARGEAASRWPVGLQVFSPLGVAVP